MLCHPEQVLYSKKYRQRGIINRIGQGKYGKIYVGCLTSKCKIPIAIKKSTDDLTKEYRIMKKAYSLIPKHIVQPYHMSKCKQNSIIYSEYFPQGTLYDNPKKITKASVLQVLMTLFVLQKNDIKHNDVHLKNILVDGKRIALTDFGLANNMSNDYKGYGIGPKSDPGYDYHMFLNLLYTMDIPRMNVLIEKLLPLDYLGFDTPKVYNYRLRYDVDHSRLPSLKSIIQNKIFYNNK